jgi:uncharacterized protein (TIGR03437 family)
VYDDPQSLGLIKNMKHFLQVLLLTAGVAVAQTAETIPFRAVLLSSNEVPAVPLNASGAATIWLHVVRDAQGRVTSASTDFDVTFTLPAANNVVGLHIHRGNAGENGPVLIDSGIRGAEPVAVGTTGRITRQGQTESTNTAGLDAVNGILTNPSGYYANMHTADFPGGVIRGQLQRADMVVLMGLMSPQNEVPPIQGLDASGIATVTALMTRDATGRPTSGEVIFDTNYRGFPEGTTFTGFHIHNGAAGMNAGVTINTGIGSGAASVPAISPGGNLHYNVEVPMTNAASVQTLQSLFTNPTEGAYINLHTTVNPGGAIRSQLRRTDTITFPVLMSPANEVPPIQGLNASGPAVVSVHTIRNADGSVAAGAVIFDVNYRFPGATPFTGLHIHDGRAGENGGVTINTGIGGSNTVVTDSGSGNIYRVVTVSTDAGMATLRSLVSNPENHYVNLHTSVNPGGAVRSQLAAANTASPVVTAAISAVSDPSITTVAPGGLMTVFGTGLVKVASDLLASGNGVMLPGSFNGTEVTIGGRTAPLLVVTPTYIVAQVPLDAGRGPQPVAVRNANGAAGATVNINVAGSAPALFFDANGGIFQKNSDFSIVTASNRARAGDIVLAYSTGLGVTSPALQSGQITPAPGATNTYYNTSSPVTVTVGGREARVIYSLASPGFAGLYQTAFEIPAGAGTGNVPVVLSIGGVRSNSVNISLQ